MIYSDKNTKKIFIRAFVTSLVSVLCCFSSFGESSVYVRGIVRDSITLEGLPFASVLTEDGKNSTVTDGRGLFEFKIPRSTKYIKATSVGYNSKAATIKPEGLNLYDIMLSPSSTELKELVVRKGKYSKKNNPAVDFARSLRKTSEKTDPEKQPDYNREEYERITIALNNFKPEETSAIIKRFPWISEHVDTSEVSGKTILPVSVTEKVSEYHTRNNPVRKRRIIKGIKREGIDEIVEQSNMTTFLEDILGEVDIFQNDVNILQNRFVSPLSSIAADFYKFYLVDTVEIENERYIVLSFYPHNRSSFGFIGSVYVAEGDTSMFVKRIEMRVPSDINLNFINSLLITQSFNKAANGTRIKNRDDLVIEASPVPGSPEVYIRRLIEFRNDNFDRVDESIFDGAGTTVLKEGAEHQDSLFWEKNRLVPIGNGEVKTKELVERLRENKFYYWGEKLLKIIFMGYIGTSTDSTPSKFDIGPVNTFASYNSLEGLRLRFGGMSTAALNKNFFFRTYGAYGFKDHKWKYGVELEYSFIPKELHSREFPIHSIKIEHSYDTDSPGQHYLFTNQDNFVLSLRRMQDLLMTYRRRTKLEYNLELKNNFSFKASVENIRQEPSRYFPFNLYDGTSLSHFTENLFKVQLRYAPGEKFYQGRTNRIPINLDAPVFVVEHTFAPKEFLGSRWGVNKTEMNISKRFWLSAFGFIDTYIGGGHVWGQTDFLDLCIPNVNLSYTIQPQSYALMTPLEFVNSSYVSWDLTYWLNGALFNLIPVVKKAKLREVVGFRGLYGVRSSKNNPSEFNPGLMVFPENAPARKMDEGPYMEISAGLDNILRILRVDYVWRLTYRHAPYPIDRSGVRVALHITF